VAREMVVSVLSSWLHHRTGEPETTLRDFFANGNHPELAERIATDLMTATLCDPASGQGVFLTELISILQNTFPESALDEWLRSNVHAWDVDKKVIAALKQRFPNISHIYEGDFLLAREFEPVDLFIANPPYVRQERLEKAYKQQLLDSTLFNTPGLKLTSRTDYYLYFLAAMVKRLKPGGVLTAIVPNGWLDNGFGAGFRRLLECDYTLEKVESLNNTRHFEAEVNTVIVTILNDKPPKNQSVRVVTDDTLRTVPLATLSGLNLGWNGSLFRAPDWLLDVLSTPGKTVPLGSLAEIHPGIITGDNKKYYFRTARLNTFVPAIKSPREIQKLTLGKADCQWWLPAQNIPFTIRRAPILWPDLRGRRHFAVHNPGKLAFEHTFYGLTPKHISTEDLTLLLNSSFVSLLTEIYGRTGLGGGALRLVKQDLEQLPVPNPKLIKISPKYRTLLKSPVREMAANDDPLWPELDRAILKPMGLENRWEEMVKLLNFFIRQRHTRARH